MPEIIYATAMLNPPINKYGNDVSAPKSNPNIAQITDHTVTLLIFLKAYAIKNNITQIYK
jgi:hypothetical protein